MRHHPARLIAKKRDGGTLSQDELQDLVAGVVDGSLGDAQLGAFLMSVCCNGMTPEETAALTIAMRDSGRVLSHDHIAKRKIDKHSTGGVGDKVSLLLAPLLAAAGVAVPMVSGRGLGHTGGTIDKLAAIPGYRTDLSLERFGEVLEQCGYAMLSPSGEIAPADRRMYATRDISGTVESIPLITSSILSKKLAEGIDGLVMDVKFGRASFMREEHDAVQLMEGLVATGRAAGIKMSALLTDMDHPLGLAIGNSLEVQEVLLALNGACPDDLREVTLALGVEMLLLADVTDDRDAARTMLSRLWGDGVVREVFADNLVLQGGDAHVLDDPTLLGRAPHVVPVEAMRAGFVTDVDPLALGHVVVDLGGGRRQPTDEIDPHVGIVLRKTLGDEVQTGDVLAFVHASTDLAGRRGLGRRRLPLRRGPPAAGRSGDAGRGLGHGPDAPRPGGARYARRHAAAALPRPGRDRARRAGRGRRRLPARAGDRPQGHTDPRVAGLRAQPARRAVRRRARFPADRLARRSGRGSASLELLCVLPATMPAILLGIALIRTFTSNPGISLVSDYDFYNGWGFAVCGYAARFLPFAALTLASQVRRQPIAAEEAGRFVQRSAARRAWTLHVWPLLPAAWSAFVLTFVLAIRELDLAVMLPAANATAVRRLANAVHFQHEDWSGVIALMLLSSALLLPLLPAIVVGRRPTSLC